MFKHSSSSSSLVTGFRSVKSMKRNQELNYKLEMKAKELEEHYAAYKLKVDHGVKNVVEKRVVEVHKESLSSSNGDGEFIRGMFYRRYMEKREAKLREEWRSKHRVKTEEKMNAMRVSLDQTHAELKAKKAEIERVNVALNQIESSDKQPGIPRAQLKSLSTSRRSTDSTKIPKSILKNTDMEPKPFLKKGRSIGPGLGAGLSKIKYSSASKNFTRSSDIDPFSGSQTSQTKIKQSVISTTLPSKGFKRFLSFGKKSNGISSTNSSERSSPRDVLEYDYNHSMASQSPECLRKSNLSYSIPSITDEDMKLKKEIIPGSPLKGALSFFSLNSFKNRGSDLKDRM
ncbi:hypothetical protein DsansV1_C02g0013461 [Dioscorea sansibarensis]